MKVLGLDIGTTTVSAVVVQDDVVLESLTLPNGSFLTDCRSWEKLQNPAKIWDTAKKAVETLFANHTDIACIGLTGQQHGIVYLDAEGAPLSPLYTWQDGRGNLEFADGETYAEYLQRVTGYANLASGYGLVTHFYNLRHGLVPEGTKSFCTIHDYVAMKLAGLTAPITEASDAASFGMFDVEHGDYDRKVIASVGIDTAILPQLAASHIIGSFNDVPVCVAIGDNQASFLGTTDGTSGCMLVNMGTGGQFSVHTDTYLTCPGLETRPFPNGGWLLVGAVLCGGRAYALLESFFRSVVKMQTGVAPDSCYEAMTKMLCESEMPEDLPEITPLFQGTRSNPALRGAVTELSTENFTALHFTYAMMRGMATELHELYKRVLDAGGKSGTLFGSGNGLRKNKFLCKQFEDLFGQPVLLSTQQEEAACGAARFAAASL